MIRKTVNVGDKFGLYTVITEPFRENIRTMVMVKCKCGSERKVNLYNLMNGLMKSCGCIHKKYEDIQIGKVVGRLTVIGLPDNLHNNQKATVKCECGVITKVRIAALNNGHTQSCGCLAIERATKANVKHGLSKHPLHKVWSLMKDRCYNNKSWTYQYYGALGVTVCEAWLNDFKAFYDWAIKNGWRKGLEVDKDIIYREKHGTKSGMIYSPEYCCLVTKSENCRARSNSELFEYKGEKKTLTGWAEVYKIKRATLRDRIHRYGWTIEDALTSPLLQ